MTITTAEICKVFDAFNTVSAQLKLQSQALESVKNSLQDLTADMQELKEDRRVLIEKVESLQENRVVDDGKILHDISVFPVIQVSTTFKFNSSLLSEQQNKQTTKQATAYKETAKEKTRAKLSN